MSCFSNYYYNTLHHRYENQALCYKAGSESDGLYSEPELPPHTAPGKPEFPPTANDNVNIYSEIETPSGQGFFNPMYDSHSHLQHDTSHQQPDSPSCSKLDCSQPNNNMEEPAANELYSSVQEDSPLDNTSDEYQCMEFPSADHFERNEHYTDQQQ